MVNEIVEVECDLGSFRVSLVGAQVTSWVPAGGEERMFMPATPPWGEEVHGGIPICWPWFERGAEPWQPMHGVARYFRWNVVERADGFLRLSLASSDETRRVWTHDFVLDYTVSLGNGSLACRLSARNTGNAPFEANDAFHPYLAVRDIEKSHIDDEPYFTTRPQHLSRRVPGAAESHVLHSPDASGECRQALRISANGHDGWGFWNPGEDQTPKLKTIALDDWRRFVCVEPVKLGKYVLTPGETRIFEMTLAI